MSRRTDNARPRTVVILDANHSFGDMLGYDPVELEGYHPGDMIITLAVLVEEVVRRLDDYSEQ